MENDPMTLPESFTQEQREELFQEIVQLYDLADDMMAAVELPENNYRGASQELATPFVTQVTNSANILSAFYTEVVHKGRPITAELQDTFEKAFQNVFYAYRDFLDTIEERFLTKEGNV